ncbi:SNW SKI-interacting [Micractinium conductrix]|uniref:SNW SKI-interacting n=1 Tax=Micractinium conductrix TaxID=554055 RepID=A0A2P6VBI7_9CHLO|nr:SNW SKI-interacting [Micractinium conductrix]|eukprot:PSC71438.1 SNW SKI-interacting [Micractinium conductrix]
MGRTEKGGGAAGGQTLALTVNAEGDINYDAVLAQSKNAQQWLQTTHKALVPKPDLLTSGNLEMPDEEEIERTARETAAALTLRVDKKQAAVNPKTLPQQPGAAQYIKYTPADGGAAAGGSGAASRIIKMQDMPVDPLQPPKFRHIKVPRGPGSPPVPVMHSPPRPMTVKDQQDWKIPPCISNWKNSKGYTIPLDKRLAADGRGLQEVAINDQFAKFSEALYIAEQKARSAVEARSKMQRELLAREKERKERELRDLALKARMDRLGGPPGASERMEMPGVAGVPPAAARGEGRVPAEAAMDVSSDEEVPRRGRGGDRDRSDRDRDDERDGESRQEREERRKREEIREERRRERERERRLESREAHGFKKSKLTRDRDRDISEKIALGMAKVTGGEAMYDQRLFNQDTGLGGPGMGQEDSYNIYDKPLFADRAEIFKHKSRQDDEVYAGGAGGGGEGGEGGEINTARFKPDKGFTGADYGQGEGGPVQFEKEGDEADPFGLDAFLSDVRAGKKKGALDDIGKGGGMRAGGGGSSYDQHEGGSGRRRDFVSGGGR